MPNEYTMELPDGSSTTVVQDEPPTEQDFHNFLKSVGLPNPITPEKAQEIAPYIPVGTTATIGTGDKAQKVISAQGGRWQSFVPFEQRPELISLLNQPDLTKEQRREIFDNHVQEYYAKLGDESNFARSFSEHALNAFYNANPIGETVAATAAQPEISTSRKATLALPEAQTRQQVIQQEITRRANGGKREGGLGFLGVLGAATQNDYGKYARILSDSELQNQLKQAGGTVAEARKAINEKRVPALIDEATRLAQYYATEAQGVGQKTGAVLGDVAGFGLGNPIVAAPTPAGIVPELATLAGLGTGQSQLIGQPAAVERGLQAEVNPLQSAEEGVLWAGQALGLRVLAKTGAAILAKAFGRPPAELEGLTGEQAAEQLAKLTGKPKTEIQSRIDELVGAPDQPQTVDELYRQGLARAKREGDVTAAFSGQEQPVPRASLTGDALSAREQILQRLRPNLEPQVVDDLALLHQQLKGQADEADLQAFIDGFEQAAAAQHGKSPQELNDEELNSALEDLLASEKKRYEGPTPVLEGAKAKPPAGIIEPGLPGEFPTIPLRTQIRPLGVLNAQGNPVGGAEFSGIRVPEKPNLVTADKLADIVPGAELPKTAVEVPKLTFIGYQEHPTKAPLELWNVEGVPGFENGTTVVRESLEQAGVKVPEAPVTAEEFFAEPKKPNEKVQNEIPQGNEAAISREPTPLAETGGSGEISTSTPESNAIQIKSAGPQVVGNEPETGAGVRGQDAELQGAAGAGETKTPPQPPPEQLAPEVKPIDVLTAINTSRVKRVSVPEGASHVQIELPSGLKKTLTAANFKQNVQNGIYNGADVKSVTPGKLVEGQFKKVKGDITTHVASSGFINIDPVLEFGAYVWDKIKDFAAWSVEMVKRFGAGIRDSLKSIWESLTNAAPEDLKKLQDRQSLGESEGMGALTPTVHDFPFPGEKPIVPKIPTPPVTGRAEPKFVETLKENAAITDELKGGLGGIYRQTTNEATVAQARDYIEKTGLNNAYDKLNQKLDTQQSPTATDFVIGRELVNIFMRTGDVDKAGNLANKIARKASTQGQAIQALSTWVDMTPEAAAKLMQRVAEYHGSRISDVYSQAEIAELNRLQRQYAITSDPDIKLVLAARRFELINNKLPVSVLAKARAFLNISMLLNPKTWIRNLVGNVIMWTAEKTADSIATPIDAGISILTGNRAVTFPQIKAAAEGLAQPWMDFKKGAQLGELEGKNAWGQFKEGVAVMRDLARLTSRGKFDVGSLNEAYRHVFSSKTMRAFEDTLTMGMSVNDRQFWSSAYKESLSRQLKLASINGKNYIGPTPEMAEQAMMDANRAIFQDDNFVSKSLDELRRGLNRISTLGLTNEIGLGQAVTPFTRIVGSIALRAAEYSPLNFMRVAYEGLAPVMLNQPFNQRAFSEAFGRTLVGSGLAGLGYWMYKKGIITGAPNKDRDIEAARKMQGMGGNQVNLSALKRTMLSGNMFSLDKEPSQEGDQLMPYDWIQPNAVSVAMGSRLAEIEEKNKLDFERGVKADTSGTLIKSLIGGSQTLLEQPVFQGITNLAENLAFYGPIDAVGRTYSTLPSQAVPTLFGQIEQYRNNTPYETRTGTGDASPLGYAEAGAKQAAAKIPTLADKLGFPARRDIFGNEAERFQSGRNTAFNIFLNPAFISEVKKNPNLEEMFQLYENTGEGKQFPRTVASSKVDVNGVKIPLDSKEIAAYQQFIGKLTNDFMTSAVASPEYSRLTDNERVDKMASLLTDINSAARVMLFGHRPSSYNQHTQDIMEYVIEQRPDLLELARQQKFNNLPSEQKVQAYQEKTRNMTDDQQQTFKDAQRNVSPILRELVSQ